MPQLRLALCQVNVTVGAIAANTEIVVARAHEAAAAGAQLVAFPEMVLTGYPVEDLALRRSFQRASRAGLDALATRLLDEGLGEVAVVVGYLDIDERARPQLGRPIGAPENALAVLHGGRVAIRSAKHHLPNYGVFDEFRYFVPGNVLPVVRLHGIDVAFAICEDLWQDGGPVAAAGGAGVGLLVVINGSPYELDKDDTRLALCARRAAEAGATLAYVNLVGGQDELVFDGDSLVVSAAGKVLARAPQFVEAVLVVDLDLPQGAAEPVDLGAGDVSVVRTLISAEPLPSWDPAPVAVQPRLPAEAEVYAALVTALGDYVRKNGFRSVILGLSGGIDSALTAAIACDAIGAANVHGVSMPSKYSSDHSRTDADDSAARLGCQYRVVEIEPMVAAYLDSLKLTGLAEENLQARVRGTTLMGLSNAEGHLVLATGNKSELAAGYSTIYGDAVGGYAPLKDVPKTLVWKLSAWRNAEAGRRGALPPIPPNSITKPPSAELRPGQLDTDSLPDYAVLDDLLDDYIERDASAADLVAAGFDPELVERILRLVDLAEYKRRQYPPGTKISLRAFGRDRRLPITNGWREQAPPT
ncbi:NAD+ synthase [Sporichthya sp.]|uniref:NAD+ synthase n=1 Tax=Sporichthya sp. TaxID=65475 RepID=UPI0017D5B3C6|nr:NAD+ synthase [Sporichthya sp.]MBA3742222.1 NAD+ synthase [Sporichthya sp.]